MTKIKAAIFLTSAILMLISASDAMAERTVRGRITDREGNPLPGASVTVQGMKGTGTTAGEDGTYSIVLEEDGSCTIRVSYIGYVSETRENSPGKNTEDFVLEEDLMNIETIVVTGTRTPKVLKDAPIMTRVITSDEIRNTNAVHIGSLLETELPGIEFTYSMNQQVSLNLQGFGGSSVLFLVDGERLAGETLDNIDYSRLNLDNVERIEIVKGAASSLYGSNAVGGVVNIITKKVKEPWSLNLNGSYSTLKEQRYGGSLGFKAGMFTSQTFVQYVKNDSIPLKNDGDYTKIYGGYNCNIKEVITCTPAEGLTLTGRAGYFFRQRDAQEDKRDRYRDYSGGIKGVYEIDGNSTVEASYGFDQYDKSGFLPASGKDIRDYSNVQHTARAMYSRNIGKSNIIVGGDYMRDYLMTYQFEDGDRIQHTGDLFAQFDWNPTEHLNIINGIRMDYFSVKNLFHVSPKLGVMYKVKDCSFRGSYSGGFRAPTLKEMFMSFDMAGIFMIYGNPDLKPEKSHNFSLSADYTKSRYNVTLTGYCNLVENRITTAWNEAQKGMMYTNMSMVRISGVDANISARYPCGIGFRVSYTFTHEHMEKGQPMTSQTRPHSATVKLEYGKDWKMYGFNAALTGRIMSAVTTDVYTSLTDYSQTERKTYPGYTMWKLTLNQRVWKGINVNATVDNLFNYIPDYYYSNSPSTIGTSFLIGLSLDIEKMAGRD